VQATELIPQFLALLGVDQAVWLYGQSDGGSIALMMAALKPIDIAGVVVTAPHTVIEFATAKGIADARAAFVASDLRRGLARHHRDPDAVMQGWGGSWLAPTAREWSIVPLLARIGCPVLAMQGELDHYGSMEQIRVIARHAPQARLLELKDCGHIAHQDQTDKVLHAAANFMRAACRQPPAHARIDWPYPPEA
jgi:pimeloyl-ACP methyl ester carboxylesterase